MLKTRHLSRSSPAFFLFVAGVLCLLFPPVFSQEQQYRFEHFGVEHGLPSGQVLCMLEDKWGFLWFGTMKGLVRYDGHNFKIYAPAAGDSTSLSDAVVTCLLEDDQGYLWAGTHRGLNRYDRKTDSFRQYFHKEKDENSLPGNDVHYVGQDINGRIWVSTSGGSAFIFPGSGKFSCIKYINGDSTQHWNQFRIGGVYADKSGSIWAWSNLGMARLEAAEGRTQVFHPRATRLMPDIPFSQWSLKYPDQRWFYIKNQMYAWDTERERFSRVIFPGGKFSSETIRSLYSSNQNRWIGFYPGGMFFYDAGMQKTDYLVFSSEQTAGLGEGTIHAIHYDRFQNLWIATSNGLFRTNRQAVKFPFYRQHPGQRPSKNYVYRAFEDTNGGWWYSLYDRRLFYAETPGEPARQVFFPPDKQDDIRIGVFRSDSEGLLWMASNDHDQYGTWKHGIFVYNFSQKTLQRQDLGDTLNHCRIHFMEEDLTNPQFLWMSATAGLCKLNKKNKERQWFYPRVFVPALSSNQIFHSLQTADRIWLQLADYFNGKLGYFDKSAQRFFLVDISSAMPGGRHEILIRGFAQTPDGTIWIASGQGLGKLNPQTLQFSLFTARDGLAETELMGIACDKNGRLWLKGLTSITRYDPRLPGQEAFRRYPIGKDMLEMNTVGAAACRDGRILMHGNNGLYAFHPDSIWHDTTPPKVVLTDFRIPDSSIHFGQSTELVTDIRIAARNARIFTFEFAALHFIDPEHIRYQYRLEGFRDEWLDIGTDRKVTFTNLRPGAYTFRVRACNADGVCSGEKEELVIRLQVLPPWWATWWACLSYLLLLAIIVQLIFRFRLRQKLSRLEALRLKELDRFKTRFYTNITHEFRTPLTLILGPVAGALRKNKALRREDLRLIKRNAERLLQLIDQLLALGKLDAGVLKPENSWEDLIPFLQYLVKSFHSYAQDRRIGLEFTTNVKRLVMDFDKEKWQTIVVNLLSNALKFTPPGSGGKVNVRLEAGEMLRLSVRDNGPGIPAEKLPCLFDRFYQAGAPEAAHPGGAGIGLALTKELVELLGGTISVESTVGEGAVFTVAFPGMPRYLDIGNSLLDIGYSSTFSIEKIPNSQQSLSGTECRGIPNIQQGMSNVQIPRTGLLILIIEDHPEAARYIASCLGPAFKTILASDGKQGLERAFELIPDLIICDVMMPEKDGYEVCRTLKRDDRTSHIPVILLTAKADTEARLEGFGQGADAYLAKPFNEAELRVRVEQMIEQRRRMQEHYRQAFLADSSGPEKIRQPENSFLQKLNAILEKHYANHRFSVDALARSAAMSQPQLHRKLSALTGRSANAFIRDFRLQKARALLTHSDLNISEIAYDCGFGAPAHFTRAFGEAFGVSPKVYRGKGGNEI